MPTEPLPPPAETLPAVDPDLRRRVAWGLCSGAPQAEVAANEGLSADELRDLLASPSMIHFLKVWQIVFRQNEKGDFPKVGQLAVWAIKFIVANARKCAVGEGVGMSILVGLYLRVSPKRTVLALCEQIEGVIGVGPKKKLRGLQAKLVSVLAWAIEMTLIQHFLNCYGSEQLDEADRAFRERVAKGGLTDDFFLDDVEDEDEEIEDGQEAGEPDEAPASTDEPIVANVPADITAEVSAPMEPVSEATPNEPVRPRPVLRLVVDNDAAHDEQGNSETDLEAPPSATEAGGPLSRDDPAEAVEPVGDTLVRTPGLAVRAVDEALSAIGLEPRATRTGAASSIVTVARCSGDDA